MNTAESTAEALDLDQRPGHCAFCDDPLPPRRKITCGNRECDREYHKAYDRRRRGTILFSVTSLFGSAGDWTQLLSCGHCVSAPTWKLRKSQRRRCLICAPKEKK